MKTPRIVAIFIVPLLLLFVLYRPTCGTAADLVPSHKIRVFFSANVQGELGPCG